VFAMKIFTFVVTSILLVHVGLFASNALEYPTVEVQKQVLSHLKTLASTQSQLSASQENIFRVLQNQRQKQRNECLKKWGNSTFSKVWPYSVWAKKDGRSWDQLEPQEKSFFRHLCIERYINKQLPDLNLPRLRISENEYSQAWKIVHLHMHTPPSWSKLSDINLKSQFRKEYHDYKVSLVGNGHFPMLGNEREFPILASIFKSDKGKFFNS